MNRPYQYYQFLPLVSFWFILMQVVLVIPPKITAQSSENHPIQYLYLVFKFVFFFGVVTTLYMSEVCNIDLNLLELKFLVFAIKLKNVYLKKSFKSRQC